MTNGPYSTHSSEHNSDQENSLPDSPRDMDQEHSKKLLNILTHFSEQDIKILGSGFFTKQEFEEQI